SGAATNGLPIGGTTGQILKKQSATDFDANWENESSGSGTVTSVTGDSVDNTDPNNPVVNAIPLSGTEVGSPVTGGIVSEASIEAISFIVPSYDVNNVVEIIDDGGTGLISVKATDTNYGTSIYSDGLSNDVNGITKLFYRAMDDLSWRIQSSMPSFRGLDSNTYYGANYTDNTYVQKKYVDEAIVGAVMETDYNANTILAATTDDTPAPITIDESQIVGRLTGGNIKGLSVAETNTLLGTKLD